VPAFRSMEPSQATLIPIETGAGVALVTAIGPDASAAGPRDVAEDHMLPKLSDAVARIRTVAGEMITVLDGLSLSKASIEFGVTFSIHSGQLVAAFVDAGQECTFHVTLEWAPS
jgi:hypothetical protein